MLAQSRLPSLLLFLPRLRSLAPGLAMSSATGTVTVQQPLNYRAGARVHPADGGQLEEVFEPATGTGGTPHPGAGRACVPAGPGVLGFPPAHVGATCAGVLHALLLLSHSAVVAALCLQRLPIVTLYCRNQLSDTKCSDAGFWQNPTILISLKLYNCSYWYVAFSKITSSV